MTDQNAPYAAPKADLNSQSRALGVVPAARGLRFGNLVVDYIAYLLFTAVTAGVLGFALGSAFLSKIEQVPDILLGLPFYLIYYTTFEGCFGRTLGKLVTGTKVVNEKGLSPSFGQVLGRTFCRLIPFEAFSFFQADARGWHDQWPKTYVVKCR